MGRGELRTRELSSLRLGATGLQVGSESQLKQVLAP